MSEQRNAPAWVTALLVVAGVVFVALTVIYLVEPARSLPSFMPGHEAGVARHHTKHGLAAAGVAVICFIGAWITSGRKTAA